MQRRLGRDRSDPSSSPSRPPDPSPTHARLFQCLEMVLAAAGQVDIPGGDALPKLMVNRARKIMESKTEEELRGYLGLLDRLSHAVKTGEGMEDILGGGEHADPAASS